MLFYINILMDKLFNNAIEFLESGEDNLKKERFNVAVSDFFKAIVIFCDHLIYTNMKIIPKNHNERFSLLNLHFKEIYTKVSELFKKYTESYNFKLKKEDALKIRDYAYELKEFIKDKK